MSEIPTFTPASLLSPEIQVGSRPGHSYTWRRARGASTAPRSPLHPAQHCAPALHGIQTARLSPFTLYLLAPSSCSAGHPDCCCHHLCLTRPPPGILAAFRHRAWHLEGASSVVRSGTHCLNTSSASPLPTERSLDLWGTLKRVLPPQKGRHTGPQTNSATVSRDSRVTGSPSVSPTGLRRNSPEKPPGPSQPSPNNLSSLGFLTCRMRAITDPPQRVS